MPTEIKWEVYRVFNDRGSLLGTVHAPDMQAALDAACKQFHITPAERRRVVVRKVGGDA